MDYSLLLGIKKWPDNENKLSVSQIMSLINERSSSLEEKKVESPKDKNTPNSLLSPKPSRPVSEMVASVSDNSRKSISGNINNFSTTSLTLSEDYDEQNKVQVVDKRSYQFILKSYTQNLFNLSSTVISPFRLFDGGLVSSASDEIYYIGIIDILQVLLMIYIIISLINLANIYNFFLIRSIIQRKRWKLLSRA